MEARVRIELTIEDLQSSALPLGDRAISKSMRGKRRRMRTRSSVFCTENEFIDLVCLRAIFFDSRRSPETPKIRNHASIPANKLQHIIRLKAQCAIKVHPEHHSTPRSTQRPARSGTVVRADLLLHDTRREEAEVHRIHAQAYQPWKHPPLSLDLRR